MLDLASRTVKIAGITSRPDEVWMMQMGCNLTDAEELFLRHTRFLIMDRDTKYSEAFRAALGNREVGGGNFIEASQRAWKPGWFEDYIL